VNIVLVQRTEHLIMGGATMGAGHGDIIPISHLAKVGEGGQNIISSTYYRHVTKSILYTFTQ